MLREALYPEAHVNGFQKILRIQYSKWYITSQTILVLTMYCRYSTDEILLLLAGKFL